MGRGPPAAHEVVQAERLIRYIVTDPGPLCPGGLSGSAHLFVLWPILFRGIFCRQDFVFLFFLVKRKHGRLCDSPCLLQPNNIVRTSALTYMGSINNTNPVTSSANEIFVYIAVRFALPPAGKITDPALSPDRKSINILGCQVSYCCKNIAVHRSQLRLLRGN